MWRVIFATNMNHSLQHFFSMLWVIASRGISNVAAVPSTKNVRLTFLFLFLPLLSLLGTAITSIRDFRKQRRSVGLRFL